MKKELVNNMQIRPLAESDFLACVELSINRGWGKEEEKWRFLLATGEGYCIEAEDGKLAATAILTRYNQIVVVGMVLVRDSLEGRGFGRKITEFALAQAGNATIYLFATELGKPLYEKLGFQTQGNIIKHFGNFIPTENASSYLTREATVEDFERIVQLDQQAFGADRSLLLKNLMKFTRRQQVVEEQGEIIGYGFSWKNVNTVHLGPLIAKDNNVAQNLITALARKEEAAVRLDLPDNFTELGKWATAQGLNPVFTASLMIHQNRPLPGKRTQLYSLIMQATG